MAKERTPRGPSRPAFGRRHLFVALALAGVILLLAACPSRHRMSNSPSPAGDSGGGMYRRY